MGIDFVWLLPIHPIGLTKRKGTLGSPYSIDNFREINPEHGNLDDFHRLVSEIHRHGMRLMIDIVFRHTSHDCPWAKEHPEWYLTDETVRSILFIINHINLFQGKPIALVPEWSDILDLKFEGNEKTIWIELIDILKYWCKLGVDGFRMDVASGVPMQFW
jgi:glycosidase